MIQNKTQVETVNFRLYFKHKLYFMTQRCLSVRLKEHATRLSSTSSAVGQHFFECEHAQFLATLQDQFTLLNDLPLPSDNSSPIENLVFNSYRILYIYQI
jgi:hypothetical protein